MKVYVSFFNIWALSSFFSYILEQLKSMPLKFKNFYLRDHLGLRFCVCVGAGREDSSHSNVLLISSMIIFHKQCTSCDIKVLLLAARRLRVKSVTLT